MQISFLLGAAGTGKTFRCLDDIRSELRSRPEGPALILLTPKQSTYQLERHLLDHTSLHGYSRLHILSFERLAWFIFNQLNRPVPEFLSEQGRTMVLRALLMQWAEHLTIFRNSARRAGFAEELSAQFREFQNHGLSAAGVNQLADRLETNDRARAKLKDLALIYKKYIDWLNTRALEDGDALLTAAADLLETDAPLEFGGLWFDGFAQLTPQELRLLTGLIRFTPRATLAFCLDPAQEPRTSISPWFLVNQTYHRCRAAIEQSYGRERTKVEMLPREPKHSRFATAAELAHLEKHWTLPIPFDAQGAIQLIHAADPEGEAQFVAREILKHVRAGGRYRDCALLLRTLENDYPHVLRRVFRRYEIPFFIDHRESVAHHPIAELTRGALRTLAYGWKHQDWFATLKSGLVRTEDLDRIENAALAGGFDGTAWRNGFSIPRDPQFEAYCNRIRIRLVQPFLVLEQQLGRKPSAEVLAAALRQLWEELSVQSQLERWSGEDPGSVLHATVWEQMKSWLDNLTLAFRGQEHPLPVWLPILETGLMNLTVGIVPPVLDQVLIGSVDRSRNPDLKMLFVVGTNERIFPAAPACDSLLTEEDRTALLETGSTLGELPALRLAAEQFYGYIAWTRPRERLVITYSRNSLDGTRLNPSRFITQLARIFPALKPTAYVGPTQPDDLLHACEFGALGIPRCDSTGTLELCTPNQDEQLDPDLALRLYGGELNLSVSSLESFASCPFQFFVKEGLRVREREEFQLDIREQGSFQHEVLAAFHEEVVTEGLKWRDVTAEQARARIGRLVDSRVATFKDGLLNATDGNRFTAETHKRSLQEFISAVIGWFKTNSFDPERVEFAFGKGSAIPGWRLDLESKRALVIHGRVDRVDLYRVTDTEAYCVIMDYKSGSQKPDRLLLHHGVQQQMPAYLLAMTRVREIAEHFQFEKLTPAGCFLLPLRAMSERCTSRTEALQAEEASRKSAFTHGGIYNFDFLNLLDCSATREQRSGQFPVRLTKDGLPHGNSFNALPAEEFEALLARSEAVLRECAERIYAGEIAIHPYKKTKQQTACKRCHMQSICRFDPWTQRYNVLRTPEEQA